MDKDARIAALEAQLTEAHKYLQEALRMQADMQIVIDRYKKYPDSIQE